MKRQHSLRRKGAVLLLILGLMAMFAISILTYMVVTSNMAETAVNSAKNDAVIEIPAQEDVEVALKDIVLGSNNARSPIGPFGILENMYGDWKDYDALYDPDAEFSAYISIFPDAGCAVVTPFEDYYGNRLTKDSMTDAQACAAYMSLFENSGSVLTFQGWAGDDNRQLWRTHVEGTSAFVLDKVITNPSSRLYSAVDGAYWQKHYYVDPAFLTPGVPPIHATAANQWQCDLWHFKVELTDDLMRFVENYCGIVDVNTNFNELHPEIRVRLNRPAYSGTGAGGFTPGEAKDATVPPELLATAFAPMPPNRLRLPFAFWGNAAAPDLRPFQREPGGKLDFRTFWAHLMDVNYDANQPDSTTGLRYVAENGVNWESYNSIMQGYVDGAYLEPIRMNPAYTAPDHRSLFLAHYGGPMNVSATLPKITPSFHRPTPFLAFTDTTPGFSFLSLYEDFYHDAGVGADALPIWMTALVRKLTPRPLPYDHWNFTGGNDYLANGPPTGPAGAYLPGDLLAPAELALRLGNSAQWDVDNDGDGVREGVWVPSGLPIRVNKDGKAYATMFSYTVLDLDGRVNVNTAGNWDQLPNNMREDIIRRDLDGNPITDVAQPYSYVDELDELWSTLPGSAVGLPFFAADSLDGSFGWRDDSDNDVKIAVRGDGRGTSNVLLYEALSSIFDVSAAATSDVTAIASNLLWRRNLSTNNNPTGLADRSGFPGTDAIVWTDAMMSSQPGGNDAGGVGVDPLSVEAYTRAMFFRYMDPVFLQPGDPGAQLIYPYRGKTTHDVNILSTAVYDFANTAFRSYDPLGAQVYTYAPRYSDNPYLASQNLLSLQDSPYSLPMLERLLRPWDSDANALPTQLVDDLGLNVDLSGNTITENERAKARQSLTTLSSDVPAPSLVFPNNNELLDGDYRGGNYGFVELIRSCVRQELYKVFRAKGVCFMEPGTDPDGNPISVPTNYWLDSVNKPAFDAKVEEITAYLASMLPPEIMAGEKIDLNALAQKNYWLDIDDTDPSNIVAAVDATDRQLHNYGLVKRMERVRGLYIVMMTLLYEDMNADTLYGESVDPSIPEMKLANYIEGSFDLLKFDKGEKKKAQGLMGQQLTATRIAQWCVNTIDFADPDATMTPFFFDPTPFDGWWLYDNDWIDSKLASGEYCWSIPFGGANPEPILPFLFDPLKGLPSEQMFHFFNDALNVSEAFVVGDYYIGPNGDVDFGPSFIKPEYDAAGNLVPGTGVYGPRKRSDEYIAAWTSREIEELHDQSSDMGFRLCWGMERPDLVLTETLSFHDLGIADTAYESDCDSADVDKVFGGTDDSFDQVRRPEGSTYLELYCTANPNVPQSRELYDYIDGMWKLRISKKTPIYTDSAGRELEMPVWRVAISASTDARGVNVKKSTEGLTPGTPEYDEVVAYNDALEQGNKLVYNKRGNSILERLSPTKSGGADDEYTDDVSFFSMQPRQFRNYPMPHNAGAPNEVVNIADLDIIQKVKGAGDKVEEIADDKIQGDWKAFNLRASNILGPAVAAKDDPGVTNEIELDRIVWFTDAQGDSNNDNGAKLGTAGKYPDALRTFANIDPNIQYLAPNQYLVVGPEKKRAIGSFAFNSTSDILGDPRFGVKELAGNPIALNHIDLEALGVPNFNPNAKYMVVESNIGNRGLNISEPLWLGTGDLSPTSTDHYTMDPYRLVNADGKVKVIDPTLKPGDPEQPVDNKLTCAVMDIPFELPRAWSVGGRNDVADVFYDNKITNYPIVQDELFGLGTIPAYKSAFLQRVADPNRPYHPLMNPYITVDWNVMDLTIFTGECMQHSGVDDENKNLFTTHADYPFSGDENKIKLAENRALNVDKGDTLSYNTDAFSSRQWGNIAQRTFAPGLQGSYRPSIRPNPWARAFRGEGDKAGLQDPLEAPLPPSLPHDAGVPVIQYLPTHTLGIYNDMGPWGLWQETTPGSGEWNFNPGLSGQYKNLDPAYMTSASSLIYWGAPRVPFEHLVWNDAPYSNPMELALVPASSPGRFGLEFVRSEGNFDLGKLYDVRPGRKGSLGSFGVFGFKDWYHNGNIKDGADDDEEWKKLEGKANVMGPYLNFFASSKKPGESLNLCKALEFVYVPSLFLGTKTLPNSNGHIVSEPVLSNGGTVLAGSNPVLISKRREPGKININTVTKPSWQAIAPHSERLFVGDRLPGTPWDDFQNGRYPFETNIVGYETDGTPITEVVPRNYTYFQPSHTLGLWAQVDGSKAPVPSYTTFLAQQDCDLAQRNSSDEDPLFDNISPATDPSGARLYNYSYHTDPADPSSPLNTGQTTDPSTLPSWAEWHEAKTSRNNLYEATAEMQRLSGLTTTRSNVFAVWVTVGYFEVERCNPGVNMPQHDPDGNAITLANLIDSNYKWYQYYQAIYPDGYTYGKELGSDFGETERHRGFSIIDRSVPVDFRRGNSSNYKNSILLQRVID